MSGKADVTAGRATIRDVAALAGVSKSLVSLVYSTPGAVSEARRERVFDAAEVLGFRPNGVARSLAGARTDFVGILVADSYNPVFAEVVDAIRKELTVGGLAGLTTSAVLPEAGAGAHLDLHAISLFGDLRPATVIVVGSVPDMAAVARALPAARIVVASAIADGIVPAITVRVDDAAGMRLVVRHLVERGHRDIAHIGGDGGLVARRRAEAYREAMREAGLGDRVRVAASDYSERAGYRAAASLIETGSMPTAITAVNDLAAVGALAALAERGPARSIAVTGYDNTFLAALSQIDLTSVDPDSRKIGREAARFVLIPDAATGDDVLIEPRLIVRGSTFARPQ